MTTNSESREPVGYALGAQIGMLSIVPFLLSKDFYFSEGFLILTTIYAVALCMELASKSLLSTTFHCISFPLLSICSIMTGLLSRTTEQEITIPVTLTYTNIFEVFGWIFVITNVLILYHGAEIKGENAT